MFKHTKTGLVKPVLFTLLLLLSIFGTALYCKIAYGSPLSTTFHIEGGIYPGAPTYTVWRDGDTYYAKDQNGQIDFESTNASYVINYCLALGGTTYLEKGNYSLTAPLMITMDYTTLKGETWETCLLKVANIDMIIISADYVVLKDLRLDGNLYEGYTGRGINQSSYCQMLTLNHIFVQHCYHDGMRLWVNGLFMQDAISDDSGGYLGEGAYNGSAVFLNACTDVWGNELDFGGSLRSNWTYGRAALEISGGGNIFLTNIRLYNSWYGLLIAEPIAYVGVTNFEIDFNTNAFFMYASTDQMKYVHVTSGEVVTNNYTGTTASGSRFADYSHMTINGLGLENTGSTASCVNGTAIAHGLVGTPTSIWISISGTNPYVNSTAWYFVPTVLSMNSTYFVISFCMNIAGTYTPVGTFDAKTIMWQAEYQP